MHKIHTKPLIFSLYLILVSKDKIRLIRKILELSDSKVGIITDTNKMYGIGSIPKECSFNYYKVEFQDDFKWNLYQKNTLNPILEIQNNDLVQKKSLYSKDIFINSALQVFPNEKGKGTIEKIEEAISELVKQEHGTIVVIKRDANQLVHKYADLSLIIKPTPLTKDNIKFDNALLKGKIDLIADGYSAFEAYLDL